ncbi:WG repeat-containing protein [Sedimentibacter sp. zth1]|uniref:WG repeat-containing protein n=1 Tax=Sedimentibacter sp. zth1 TaxID=2816908 RepID=UPI001A928804|nr:WG repeat-containing protein [Sedimentibacter sp. zth1]QSX04710.1 WG repeat-containing protein [Sedimentibacter sp. zth1]
MKKLNRFFIILGLMLVICVTSVYGVEYNWFDEIDMPDNMEEPIKIKKDGLWGLMDYDGNLICNPLYSEIGKLSDGLFLVKKGNIYGFVDIDGEMVINPQFSYGLEFNEDLAVFNMYGLYGYIDKKCDIIIKPLWTKAEPFVDGLAKVSNNDNKQGFIDKQGNVVIQPVWDSVGQFSNELCSVSSNGKMGYINKNGEVVIDLNYDWVEKFVDGTARVILNGKYGVINTENNQIIDAEWDYISQINNSIFTVSKIGDKQLYGYIDKTGHVISSPIWENTKLFNENLAPVRLNELWGFIDKSGKLIIDCKYIHASLFIKDVAVVKENEGSYKIIDKNGNFLNNIEYTNYKSYINSPYIAVLTDDKWGVINNYGETIVDNVYDEIALLGDKYFAVKKDSKWGIIDCNSNIIVDYNWDEIVSFNNNMIVVKKDNLYTLINKEGKYPFVSDELKILGKLGLIKGNGNGITLEYANKTSTRIQSAIIVLRMNGLEEQALSYSGQNNFNESKGYSWKQGINIMAFLKDNPGVGFIGDTNNNFMPLSNLTYKQYVKVLLENLGYKQDVDFKYDETLTFVQSLGIDIDNKNTLSNNDMAEITIKFLQTNTKDGQLLIEKLISNNIVSRDTAKSLNLVK